MDICSHGTVPLRFLLLGGGALFRRTFFAVSFIGFIAFSFAIGFVAFLIWELTAANPVVDVRIFKHRTFAVATAAVAIGYGAFFAGIVMTPLWLQQVVGYTATEAGYVTAFAGMFAVVMAPIAARLIGKVDLRAIACFGVVWLGGVSFLRVEWTLDVGFWTLAFPQIMQGIGMPFFFIGMTTLAMSSVATAEITSAAGIMAFMRTLSGAIGTALATTAWDMTSRVSRSDMVSRLNDPTGALAKMQAGGMSSDQARGALDRMVEVQASTIGASHVYLFACAAFAIAAMLVWLAPKPVNVTGPADAH